MKCAHRRVHERWCVEHEAVHGVPQVDCHTFVNGMLESPSSDVIYGGENGAEGRGAEQLTGGGIIDGWVRGQKSKAELEKRMFDYINGI